MKKRDYKISLIEEAKHGINSEDIEIPNLIPANKHVIFGENKAILSVADSLSEATLLAAKNGHHPPFTMKYNGSKDQQIEYVYLEQGICSLFSISI